MLRYLIYLANIIHKVVSFIDLLTFYNVIA